MKKVIYKLSIVAALTVIGTTNVKAQYSSEEEYKPFSSSSPFSNQDISTYDTGELPGGPGEDLTPIGDGYAAILLLAIPYAFYLYRRKTGCAKS